MNAIPTIKFDSSQYVSELCFLGKEHGADKSPLNEGVFRHAYTPIYNFLFAPIRYRQINLVEIGVGEGSGLSLFRSFFPKANLFGIDRNAGNIERCALKRMENVELALTDASDGRLLSRTFAQFGCLFDIIIDDASHKVADQINVIHTCLPFLKVGGMLVIEDIFRDETKAPEQTFCDALTQYDSDITAAYFVLPENDRISVGGWNNEKLLIVVKGQRVSSP